MKTKKTYSAPAVEIVPVAMNSMLMWSNDGSLYGMYFWANAPKDEDGFNIWQ